MLDRRSQRDRDRCDRCGPGWAGLERRVRHRCSHHWAGAATDRPAKYSEAPSPAVDCASRPRRHRLRTACTLGPAASVMTSCLSPARQARSAFIADNAGCPQDMAHDARVALGRILPTERLWTPWEVAMYCVKCGIQLPPSAAFCFKCGAAQGASARTLEAEPRWETCEVRTTYRGGLIEAWS